MTSQADSRHRHTQVLALKPKAEAPFLVTLAAAYETRQLGEHRVSGRARVSLIATCHLRVSKA